MSAIHLVELPREFSEVVKKNSFLAFLSKISNLFQESYGLVLSNSFQSSDFRFTGST